MRIPTNWLREYVDTDLSVPALADLLTRLGIGIEAIEDAPAGLGGVVLEAELTPNRGDCLSMIGIAREVAAATGAELKLPAAELMESPEDSISGRCEVVIEAPDLCPRYSARLVLNVASGPSPEWMQQRLLACGQRPIDVLVDVTNYVLFELGQPLHAFDHALLGNQVLVRRARDGEMIVTLDGVKRTLNPEQLVITDGERAVALAGVMGGANTEVTATTRNVLLEAAHFAAPCIRRTARSLGLESESSYRFARIVDPGLTVPALNRAAALLAECAGGTVAAGVADAQAQPFEPLEVGFRPSRCNLVLGTAISAEEMGGHLAALGLQVRRVEHDRLAVTVPTYRPDLTREVDLIEEVARLHGYDHVPMTLPHRSPVRTGRLSARQRVERRVRELLRGAGLHEVVTLSITSPEAMAKARMGSPSGALGVVHIDNPVSEEFSVLRWSMLPSMLEVVSRNASVGIAEVRVYDIGRTYAGLRSEVTDEAARAAGRVATGQTATTLPVPCTEELTLAGAVTARSFTSAWNLPPQTLAADLYEVKGLFDLLLDELQIEGVTAEPCHESLFGLGRAAQLRAEGRVIAVMGEVDETVLDAYDIRMPMVAFEADLGWLLDHADLRRAYRPLRRQPAVLRDIALVVATDLPAGAVEATLRSAAGEWLEAVRLFDVYSGQGIPEGRRSLAFALTFRDPARTLTDSEVDEVMGRIVTALDAAHGAKLRE